MKIALLNLPIDNNYGGNLQRFALMMVLRDMGHDVTHIQLKSKAEIKWFLAPLVFTKRVLFRYLFRRPVKINQEARINELYQDRLKVVIPFYEKYIKHTEECFTAKDIKKITEGQYDAFIVGSDQCWRKDMNDSLGWKTFLFGFLPGEKAKRIAYGASFGKDTVVYGTEERKEFCKLYERFTAVSVREKSGLKILEEMGCFKPVPQLVLDPTLLLNKEEYLNLIDSENATSPAKGKVFCYVLDKTDQIDRIAQEKAAELQTEVVFYGIYGSDELSIEMWLKSIYEADFVITDSYHGTIFSLIFNKRFIFCGNERRGNSRIDTLFDLFGIDKRGVGYCDTLPNKVKELRESSIDYLRGSLR